MLKDYVFDFLNIVSRYSIQYVTIFAEVVDVNNINYSMPVAMAFKRYHCIHCGAVLKKERTHRVVTKDDKDYYQYHNYGSFPLRDHDVYDYRFQCPACGKRISFNEQCVMSRIQKKQGHFILSSSEIKDHYKACTEEHRKRVLARGVLTPVVFGLLAFALHCYNQSAA